MKVCLICEGSYPYVAGGVSGWVQMIVEKFTDIEFVIWSIATTPDEMKDYKYALPSNVAEVRTIYLSERGFQSTQKKISLSPKEKAALKQLIYENQGGNIPWSDIMELFSKNKDVLSDILMGPDFFDIAVDYYRDHHTRVCFNSFLWNLRAMYFPLASAMSGELPVADLYHSVSTGYAGILGSIASYIQKKPFLITEHGIYTREREEEIIKSDWVSNEFKNNWMDFFNKLSGIAYYRASRVITLFETNKQLEIELGCPPEKIGIVPNGVDVASYESLQSEGKLPKDCFNIGVVARVVPIKDVKTMIYAFDAAKRRNHRMALYILGPAEEDKEYYAECLQLIQEIGVEGIFFLGHVNIREYLPDFDMMLLTSISEGQPLAVLEGMAAYLPQVCTNVGSCANLLYGFGEDKLGEAGIIVPIMDVEKIASAIVKLATDSTLRSEMGRVGHERVSRYYQKKDFLEKYYTLYRQLIDDSSKGEEEHGGNRV